ncbi:hypothetical protein PMIN01_06040 [Paraphaeosphaeria minitans]|uniref:Uncharacterized protein n=1 Tax=Paraphaeosphaeria minitans TaxID=565426 RepID=A0A9P6GJI3_9PLEO|nr:hypothetical protein PMIN01_06040 [Paraphaeosphaeria minitans]
MCHSLQAKKTDKLKEATQKPKADCIYAARAQAKTTGELLSTAAEAYMSLGNVASPKGNGQYFRQALEYLRSASELPGYALPLHLQT